MNIETCDNDAFGRDFKPGTPVKVKIRKTGVELEGKVYSLIRAGVSPVWYITLDGVSSPTHFYASEVTLEEILPEVEPGFYLNQRGVIFHITGKLDEAPRLVSLSRMAKGSDYTDAIGPIAERHYYHEIREGKTVRIADANGVTVKK